MPGCSGERLYQCICSQVTYETSICSTSLLTRGIGSLLILAVLLRVWWQPLHVSSALSLTHSNTEHLLTFVWTLTYFVRCQFTSFCPFKNPSCLFKRKEFWTSLLSGYILRIFPSNLWEEIFSIYLWSAVSYYFLIKKCLFIWLHPDLAGACGIISLHRGKRDFSCSMQTLVVACGIEFLDQGSNPDPLHGQHGVLATGPPGKSLPFHILKSVFQRPVVLDLMKFNLSNSFCKVHDFFFFFFGPNRSLPSPRSWGLFPYIFVLSFYNFTFYI